MSSRIDFWTSFYIQDELPWHLQDVNPILEKYKDKIINFNPKRIFVPLCGKTVDMKWFYEQGYTVVGLDAFEKAAIEFFEESKLIPVIKGFNWGKIYETQDSKLKFYVTDFFTLDLNELGKFDAVYDRGSLNAIYLQDRDKYVQIMELILEEKFIYILLSLEYNGTETKIGPPRSIPVSVAEQLFGDFCDLEVLEREAFVDKNLEKLGVEGLFDIVLWLTRKQKIDS